MPDFNPATMPEQAFTDAPSHSPEPLERKDIRKTKPEDLEAFLLQAGEKKFRASQVSQWIWNKQASSFEQMTNVSLATRHLLSQHFEFRTLEVEQAQHSTDGTIKSAFRLHDNQLVEGVLIPADDRMTACVSSQVGCSLTCKFCATGYMERVRNLESAEIYDQVVAIRRQANEHFNQPLTNIVYMGMGEPLLNYANVLASIDRITSPSGLGMAARRITLSTAGISKMIAKLGDDQVRFNLALSLHAANDVKRNQIMPINETNTLAVLEQALHYFYNKTGTRITYEYIVFNNFNDTLTDAAELYQFTRHTPCKVNIIDYNPIAQAEYRNTSNEKLEAFRSYLEARGVIVSVRRSRGKDIDAACGQLAIKQPPIKQLAINQPAL
jgi:23S rRNA (adenine2503-C2)-methyltransferase